MGIEDLAGRVPHHLSGGEKKRVAIAGAIAMEPEVLVLDEPTAGVDPTGQIEIRKILLNIARTEKKTVLLSSHNLDEVQRICNRVALIDRGEIKLYGELEELRQKMGRSYIVIETSGTVTDSVLDDLGKQTWLGFHEIKGTSLFFESREEGAEVSDIVTFLSGHGVKIEQAGRQEASLEDLYSSILKEVDKP